MLYIRFSDPYRPLAALLAGSRRQHEPLVHPDYPWTGALWPIVSMVRSRISGLMSHLYVYYCKISVMGAIVILRLEPSPDRQHPWLRVGAGRTCTPTFPDGKGVSGQRTRSGGVVLPRPRQSPLAHLVYLIVKRIP